jgi:hypothetical protein
LSSVRCPHIQCFDVAVAKSSRRCHNATSGPPPLRSRPNSCGPTRGSALRSSAITVVAAAIRAHAYTNAYVRSRIVVVVVIAPVIPLQLLQSRPLSAPVARQSPPWGLSLMSIVLKIHRDRTRRPPSSHRNKLLAAALC